MRRIGVLFAIVFIMPPALAELTPPPERWSTPPGQRQALLVHKTFHSEAMNVEVGYNIYLPAGYDAPPNREKRYPVLYWLHGMGQSESTDQYPAHYLDEAIKGGRVKPMIIVYASGGQRTFYSDNPSINVMPETEIVKELIPHIDSTYRTLASRGGRAIAGMSMGGFGALKLAFKYPELFSSVTAFAPAIRNTEAFTKDRPDILRRMFANDPATYAANHPATWLKQNVDQIKGKLPISIYVGKADYLLDGAREMDETLSKLKVDHGYTEFEKIDHNLVKLSDQTKESFFEFVGRSFKLDDSGEPRRRGGTK